MRIPVFVGRQAGKVILSGTLSAAEIITALVSSMMSVNPNAQRSLARGAGKESTKELLDDDRAHRTPRMRELVGFYLRVMESVEQGDNRQGFLGAVQLVIPDRFTGARLHFVEEKGLSGDAAVAMNALGPRRLAMLEADPALGETLFEIGDGQGRCFAFYSFQRAVMDALTDRRRRASVKRDAAADQEIARLQALKDRIHAFLSATDVTFVCYASEVRDDGRIVGLGEDAEKRLYIESNALNSQATKEEVIKYESFSPVIVLLQEDRTEPENLWMDVEYIEEDSKVVGKSSPKLFTLSALTQAYSYSILGDTDPISNPNAEMFRKVAERAEFVRAYWRRISRAFGPLWVPPDPEGQADGPDAEGRPAVLERRLAYLEQRRRERNVAFQAVFLHALGRLGFALGESAGWAAGAAVLDKLEMFGTQSWKAYAGSDAEARDVKAFDPAWARAMMKPHVNRETGEVDGYAFEHAGDKIRATEQRLAAMLESGGGSAGPSAVAAWTAKGPAAS
jgi:hypothetical protein